MIVEKLKTHSITLVANKHDNTFTISPTTADFDLINFRTLLGFPRNHVVKINTTATPIKVVDKNLGLWYVNIFCDFEEFPRGKKKNLVGFPSHISQPTVEFNDDIFQKRQHQGSSR